MLLYYHFTQLRLYETICCQTIIITAQLLHFHFDPLKTLSLSCIRLVSQNVKIKMSHEYLCKGESLEQFEPINIKALCKKQAIHLIPHLSTSLQRIFLCRVTPWYLHPELSHCAEVVAYLINMMLCQAGISSCTNYLHLLVLSKWSWNITHYQNIYSKISTCNHCLSN